MNLNTADTRDKYQQLELSTVDPSAGADSAEVDPQLGIQLTVGDGLEGQDISNAQGASRDPQQTNNCTTSAVNNGGPALPTATSTSTPHAPPAAVDLPSCEEEDGTAADAAAAAAASDSKRGLGRLSAPPQTPPAAKRPRGSKNLNARHADSPLRRGQPSSGDDSAAAAQLATTSDGSDKLGTPTPSAGFGGQHAGDPNLPVDVVLRIEIAKSREVKFLGLLMVCGLLAGVAVTTYLKISAQRAGTSWYLLHSETPNFRDNFVAGILCTSLLGAVWLLYLMRGVWFALQRLVWHRRRLRYALSRLAELTVTIVSMAAWTYAGNERRLEENCRKFHSTLLWTYAVRMTASNTLMCIWTMAARGMTVHRGGPVSLRKRMGAAARQRVTACCRSCFWGGRGGDKEEKAAGEAEARELPAGSGSGGGGGGGGGGGELVEPDAAAAAVSFLEYAPPSVVAAAAAAEGERGLGAGARAVGECTEEGDAEGAGPSAATAVALTAAAEAVQSVDVAGAAGLVEGAGFGAAAAAAGWGPGAGAGVGEGVARVASAGRAGGETAPPPVPEASACASADTGASTATATTCQPTTGDPRVASTRRLQARQDLSTSARDGSPQQQQPPTEHPSHHGAPPPPSPPPPPPRPEQPAHPLEESAFAAAAREAATATAATTETEKEPSTAPAPAPALPPSRHPAAPGGAAAGAGPSPVGKAVMMAAGYDEEDEVLYIDGPWWEYLSPVAWLWFPFQCLVGANVAFMASKGLNWQGGSGGNGGGGSFGSSSECMDLFLQCKSMDNASVVSLGVLLASEVVYVIIYFTFCFRAFAYLRSRSYVLYRDLNIYLSIEVRIRGLALLFLVVNEFVQALVVPLTRAQVDPSGGPPGRCRFSLDYLLGLWSTQTVTCILVCIVAWIYLPRSVRGDLPIMQATLQRFAWTERDLPGQRALRLASLPHSSHTHIPGACCCLPITATTSSSATAARIQQLEREPMFCFEMAVKLNYWCETAYYYEEPGGIPPDRPPMSKLMELFGLKEIIVKHNEESDAKVLISWSWERCLLCFRGTASLKAACVDLQAVLVPYYQRAYWRQHRSRCRGGGGFNGGGYKVAALASVHRGFQWSWVHGGFNEEVLDWVVDYRRRHPHGKIVVTGHSLGGAHAMLCTLDLVRVLGDSLPPNHITCYTYGAPRVGDHAFASLYDKAVDETWHVINGNDMVPLSPKFIGWFVYKQPGHKAIVKRRGDLIVRPTFAENTVVRLPWSRSIRQHLLGSYLRSLMAVLRGQTRGKHIEGGVRGLLQLSSYKLPEVDSVLMDLLQEVHAVASAAADAVGGATANGTGTAVAAAGSTRSRSRGAGDLDAVAGGAAAAGGASVAAAGAGGGGGGGLGRSLSAEQASTAAALAASRAGRGGHKVLHYMARHGSLRLLMDHAHTVGSNAAIAAAAAAAATDGTAASPRSLPSQQQPEPQPPQPRRAFPLVDLHARELLGGLMRRIDMGMQLFGVETGMQEQEEDDAAAAAARAGARGGAATGARSSDGGGRAGDKAGGGSAVKAAQEVEMAAYKRAAACRDAAQERYRRVKSMREKERRTAAAAAAAAAAGGGRGGSWVSTLRTGLHSVAAASSPALWRGGGSGAAAGGGGGAGGAGAGTAGLEAALGLRMQALSLETSPPPAAGGGRGGTAAVAAAAAAAGADGGSGGRRKKLRAARRSGKDLAQAAAAPAASAPPLPGSGGVVSLRASATLPEAKGSGEGGGPEEGEAAAPVGAAEPPGRPLAESLEASDGLQRCSPRSCCAGAASGHHPSTAAIATAANSNSSRSRCVEGRSGSRTGDGPWRANGRCDSGGVPLGGGVNASDAWRQRRRSLDVQVEAAMAAAVVVGAVPSVVAARRAAEHERLLLPLPLPRGAAPGTDLETPAADAVGAVRPSEASADVEAGCGGGGCVGRGVSFSLR